MKIFRIVPNFITSMNLLCGLCGVIFTFEGHIEYAFPLMIVAAICDFLDGLAARLLKAYSAIGKELDSLADMVSFGILPSLMLFKTMSLSGTDWRLSGITLAIAVFSALRLAKFNIDERQGESFIGLATPSSAMICGSLAYYSAMSPDTWLSSIVHGCWFLPVLAIVLSALMVSEIPMFAMKFGKGHQTSLLTKIKRTAFISIVAILIIVVIVTRQNWSLIVLMTFSVYVLMNILFCLFPSTRD